MCLYCVYNLFIFYHIIYLLSLLFTYIYYKNSCKDNDIERESIDKLEKSVKELSTLLSTAKGVRRVHDEEEKEEEKNAHFQMKNGEKEANFVLVKSKNVAMINILNNVYEKAGSKRKELEKEEDDKVTINDKVEPEGMGRKKGTNVLLSQNEENKKNTLVLKSTFLPVKIDSLKTVAVAIFGEKYRWLGEILVLDHPVWSKKWYIKLNGLLFLFTSLLPILTLYKTLDSWFAILFLHATISGNIFAGIFSMNWQLFKILLSCYELYFSLYCSTGFLICCITVFDDRKMSVFFLCLIVYCFTSLLSDAQMQLNSDPKLRKQKAISDLLSVVVFDILVWYCGFFFNWFKIENLPPDFTFGVIHFAWITFGLSCWQSFIYLKLNTVYSGLVYPSNTCVLKSKLKLQVMSESEAEVYIIAVNEIYQK